MVMHFSEQCLYNVHLALPTTCCCFREEKDYSKWARDRLKELLLEMECPVFSTGELKISDVVTAEGDATILYLRGKKRLGFELNLKAKWKGGYLLVKSSS